MATIEIIIRDDNGNIISQKRSMNYELNLGKEGFSEIEGAVESFRLKSLPEITKLLLEESQKKFVSEKKTT